MAPRETPSGSRPSASEDEFLSSTGARAGVAALVLFVMLVVVFMRFDYDLTLPPLPPKPPPPSAASLRGADFRPEMFQAYLQRDAREFGVVPTPTAHDLSAPLAYELVDSRQPLLLGGSTVETRTLRLSLRVEKLTAASTRGTHTTAHLILRIENKTESPLAFRVDTTPAGGGQLCLSKGDFTYNAVALLPHEVEERTECIYREGMTFFVDRIETMVLPQLSYYYVSRLYPAHIGLDVRAARGHEPPKGKPCTDIPEQAIRRGMDKGMTTWRDVVDFYARHRCDTYLFPVGYRALTKIGETVLPVSAESLVP
jgi:hypothetical protein